MKKSFVPILISLLAASAACTINFNFATPTGAPTVTASGFPWPNEPGTCTLTTTGSVTLYNRPSTESQIFSEVGSGFSAEVDGRTVDGWVGFDPAIAQAANIGVFRLRWAFFDDVSLSGNCIAVPELAWVPEPDLCYTMPMSSVKVYSSPDTSSSVLATLEVEDFAAVTGYASDGWAQVDLGAGNTGLSGTGWMEQSDLNLNGDTCDELPTVSP